MEVQNSLADDTGTHELVSKLLLGSSTILPYYTYDSGFLRYEGWLYIGSNSNYRAKILIKVHSSPTSGHGGIHTTPRRVKHFFYWPNLRRDFLQLVSSYDICQRYKAKNTTSPWLLQPLPIPQVPWRDITMDYIKGLPSANCEQAILVVIDGLSKNAHFMSLPHPFITITFAYAFFVQVNKLHGLVFLDS